MKVTLFMGAGFSAAFNHPVMDDFLGFADSCPRLTNDDRSFLGKLVLEARRANSFLESSPTNLEDILSFSEMGDRLKLTDPSEKRSSRLRKIVQMVYTTSPHAKDYWNRYVALQKFLGIGRTNGEFAHEIAFITTNYDLNIESACVVMQRSVTPGFEFERITDSRLQTSGSLYSAGGIPLYKLHGSVNWYSDAQANRLLVEDRIVDIQGRIDVPERLTLPYPCTKDYRSDSDAIIVPPSFLKPDLPEPLKAVWNGAAKTLSQTNVLVFVGYSFPSSDTEMMFFLARALSENAVLRRVYLVDPRADEITKRLRAPGSRIGSHFRDMLEPVAEKWTSHSLKL